MIERYTPKKMGALWSLENKYKTWLEVEMAACEVLTEEGTISPKEMAIIRDKAKFDPKKIAEIEEEVKHDVLAFLTNISENLGDAGRHVHFGMTSSDVLDTSFALLMSRSLDQILSDLSELMRVLQDQAYRYKDTVQIGRSHGIHAEPTTFGLKLALYYEELKRDKHRLQSARKIIAVGKISGAVGTYAHLPPLIETKICKRLNLEAANISTQVIQRDRHAEVFTTLAILGGTLEKMAVEIRHLQRTEVREVEEKFSKGQKGSSAMPHKRNPIASENITGCARLLRSYSQAALENIALWHERDISHSSVERVIAPDATILADYMLQRMTKVMKTIVVYPENMKKNLEISRGLIFSQALLLELVAKGFPRDEAYHMVQRNAMKVWDNGGNFKEHVLKDKQLRDLFDAKTLNEICSLEHYIKHRDEIFDRVF